MKKYKLHKLLFGSGDSNLDSKSCSSLEYPHLPSRVNTNGSQTKQIIAIGDIHGDLDLAIGCLKIAGVIEETQFYDENTCIKVIDKIGKPLHYKWIGKNTIIVQVGDQIDRCRPSFRDCTNPRQTVNDEDSDLKILFLFHDLHLIAIKSPGCAVYSLLGNHELMNVLGDLRYVSYEGLVGFKSDTKLNTKSEDIFEERKKAFAIESTIKKYKDKTNIANFLACARVSSLIVDKYLFVHAGVLDDLIKYTSKITSDIDPIEFVNETIKKWLLNLDTNKEQTTKFLSDSKISPFWPRFFGSLPSNLDINNTMCKDNIDSIKNGLKKYNINLGGIIVGHTPQIKTGISSTCSNFVWRVDVAASQAFDNSFKKLSTRRPQVLQIKLRTGLNNQDEFKVLS